MNFYTFVYRLDSDRRDSRRYWEGFAPNFESAFNELLAHATTVSNDLFSQIILISKSEYLSVFK